MRGIYTVEGLVSDFKKGEMHKKEKLQVNVTKDKLGCTVSISSIERELQFSVPFDAILKEMTRR